MYEDLKLKFRVTQLTFKKVFIITKKKQSIK